MIVTFFRILKSAWVNFKRNIWLSVATISTLVLSLSMVMGLLILSHSTDFLVFTLQDKVDISVYFKSEVSEDRILKVKQDFLSRPDVKDIEYISRAQALEKFKERHKQNDFLMASLDELGENPLQASLNIKAFEASQYESLANLFETISYKNLIEKVNYRQNQIVINKIFSISKTIKVIGLILSLVLAGIAGLVAFNTIRLAIYSQKDEISIMRLVGAGNWFIRGPFIIEGMISGLLSALITLVIFFFVCLISSGPIAKIFSGFDIFHYYITHLFGNFFILLLVGVGLGALSSFIAIRRYLEV